MQSRRPQKSFARRAAITQSTRVLPTTQTCAPTDFVACAKATDAAIYRSLLSQPAHALFCDAFFAIEKTPGPWAARQATPPPSAAPQGPSRQRPLPRPPALPSQIHPIAAPIQKGKENRALWVAIESVAPPDGPNHCRPHRTPYNAWRKKSRSPHSRIGSRPRDPSPRVRTPRQNARFAPRAASPPRRPMVAKAAPASWQLEMLSA